MIKRKGYLLTAVLFGLSFMTACSKNLMPPEGLDGATPVGSQMSQSSQSSQPSQSGGSAGRGFNITEQGSGSGSGFLAEENVGESARSGGFSSGGSDGSALGGGRFQSDAEPFLGNDSGSGSGFGSG
ncbi:MAG: hypothetical protein HOG74_08760, partial [Nitrospina sp.]|nr:hypothetical protein [Nitrospina sp.]